MAYIFLVCMLTAAAPSVPAGMDLLYGDAVALRDDGEPVIAVGLMAAQKRATIAGEGGLWLDYHVSGDQRSTALAPGAVLGIKIHQAQAAAIAYRVVVETVEPGETFAIEKATKLWRSRGFALQQGSAGVVLPMAKQPLSNQVIELGLDVDSKNQALQLIAQLKRRFGAPAQLREVISKRPTATLRLEGPTGPLGLAQDYVRITTKDARGITVFGVEVGAGYAWHRFEDTHYRGDIYVVVDASGKLAVVNVIGAEALLRGVVPAEIFGTAPSQAIKAQAVAARSILLSKLMRRHHTDPFHLCAQQHCQVYGGLEKEHANATAAVQQTRGEVLFHSERLVDAVYSSSCGGHTEDNEVVWGEPASPALRGRPDIDQAPPLFHFAGKPARLRRFVSTSPQSYCGLTSHLRPERFRWRKSFAGIQLDTMVRAAFPHLGRLKDLIVEGRGRGGRVTSMMLIGTRARARLERELPIRRFFDNLNSAAFVLDVQRDHAARITHAHFIGGGWGHGVGMCQQGAIGRAEHGYDYEAILRHYYNDASIVAVYGASQAPSASTAAR